MPLPELEQHRVVKLLDALCDKRVPPHVRDQIKLFYKITGRKVVLTESRPRYDDPTNWYEMRIAQIEYDIAANVWSLYGYDRNEKRVPISRGPLETLVKEVDADRTGLFWG